MPTLKLTARNVPSLKAHPDPAKRVVYRDLICRGLYLEVFGSGARTFGVWYRANGKAGRLTLGRYQVGVYGLADAREAAREALHVARQGVSPSERKRRGRAAGTFGDLAESFLTDIEDKVRPITLKGWTALLRSDDLKALRAKQPDKVERGDVVRLLDHIKDRAPTLANRAFEVIRRSYNWALSRDLVKSSPCVGIEKPTKEVPRRRSYNDEELAAIVSVLDGERKMGDAIRLVLYTGTRIAQALGAAWAEFDLAKHTWLIPGERSGTKNALPWLVPLSAPGVALLERLKREAGQSPWVFSVRKRKGDTVDGHAWRQQRTIESICLKSGVSDFRPHDLRRTLTSWLAANRVDKDIRDAVLGHKPPRLEATYNVHDYAEEKRSALERWAAHVERLTSGERPAKVASIR